jgi:two-component system, LytTR family, sensor kinase
MIDRMNGIIRYTFLLLLFLLGRNGECNAQSGQSYSKSRMPDKQVRINLLLDSAEIFLKDSPQKSFDYVDQALELSISEGYQTGEVKCYTMLGKVSYELEQFDLATDYFKKALILIDEGDEVIQMKIYLNMAQALEKNMEYFESIDFYKKYLDYVSEQEMTPEIISVRYDLARVYTSLGDYPRALREYDAIQRIEESQNNPTGLANVNTKQGDVYLEQEKSKEAITKYKKAVDLAGESKDEGLQTSSLRKLGRAYRSNKQYNEELEVRQQSLEINEGANKLEEQAEDNLSIAEIYIEQDKPEQAVGYIRKSIDLSEQSGSDEKKGMALKTLSEAYKEQGAYDKALYAYKDYTAFVDTAYARRERELRHNLAIVASINRKLQRIDLLEKDYELNRRTLEVLQKEQDLRSKELKSQKRITYLLLLVIAALLTASLLVYRSSVQKKKANLLLALRSLRSQMNPHFIFNSLNSVNSFIAQNNERLANKYLSDFSLLMRMVLENSKHDFVPVASELEIINLYLKLEHFRFADKFDYTIRLDDAIDLNETRIPPMLIQPYIENAIWHGLRYKENKGILEVVLKKEDDFIMAIISDDGIGRKHSQELKTKHQKAGSSTGLKNTNNRLEIINEIYKTKFKVTINDLDGANETGTVVEIRIPVKQGTEEE